MLSVGLAVALALGMGVAATESAPPAAAQSDETNAESSYFPRSDYYPQINSLPTTLSMFSANKCTSIGANPTQLSLGELSAREAFKKFNCSVRIVSKNQFPTDLIPERKISKIYQNCNAKDLTLNTGFSEVQYVETANSSAYTKGREESTGITVTNKFNAGILGDLVGGQETSIALSQNLSHSWSWTDTETKALQTGHWINDSLSTVLPPFTHAYFGYKDHMQQIDLLWQWTPDPNKPHYTESAVQTILLYEYINGTDSGNASLDATGTESTFGSPRLHIVNMTPAEIRKCWEGGLPSNWDPDSPNWNPNKPYLNYVGNGSAIVAPIVKEPEILHPQGDTLLGSYPFLYSSNPLNSPITRNLTEASLDPYVSGTAMSQRPSTNKVVTMWGRTKPGAKLSDVTVTAQNGAAPNSLVMPPGTEVGFWLGGACTKLTAEIGGSHPISRDYAIRLQVFDITFQNGRIAYRQIDDVQVPSAGSAEGAASASGNLSIALPDGPEAIAIRAYRPDGGAQDMAQQFPGESVESQERRQPFSGNRDVIVIANGKLHCTPDKKTLGDRYVKSAYIGEISEVSANLVATEQERQDDPYLNMRPIATPVNGWAHCAPRPTDYIGVACAGTPTTSGGVVYPDAIGLHTPSQVEWGLTSPTCSAFRFGAAFDDAVANDTQRRAVSVKVFIDNKLSNTVWVYPDRPNAVVWSTQPLNVGPHMIRLELNPEDDGDPFTDDKTSSHINILNPTLTCEIQDDLTGATTVESAYEPYKYLQLSDLNWSLDSEIAHYRPAARNKSLVNGGPITIGGLSYSKGVSAHSVSKIDVVIPRTDCDVFLADVGVMDSGLRGTVTFEAWDGTKKLAASGKMSAGQAPSFFSANITGVKVLTLKVLNGGDNIDWDHAAWANAQIACAPPKANPNPEPEPEPDPEDPDPAPVSDEKKVVVANIPWAQNDWAWRPARSGKNLDNGAPATLKGHTLKSAVAAVAGSTIGLALDGKCTAFNAKIGVDEFSTSNGSLVFEVWDGDGRRLFQSPVMHGLDDTLQIKDLNISGANYLKLVVTDAGDGLDWDHAVWGDAELTCDASSTLGETRPEATIFLSDKPWRSVEKAHWMDPPRTNRNYLDTDVVRIGGKPYEHGIGAHSWSVIRIPIGGTCSTFTTDIGIDDTAGNRGYVTYEVWGDSTLLWTSPPVTGAMAAISVSLDVTGYQELALTVDEVNEDYTWDHASWGDPQVVCSG